MLSRVCVGFIVSFSFLAFSSLPLHAQIDQMVLRQIDSLQRLGKWSVVKPIIEQNIDAARHEPRGVAHRERLAHHAAQREVRAALAHLVQVERPHGQ